MEVRFFWVADAVKAKKFNIKYNPEKENLGDYQSKHHLGTHYIAVCPRYLHEKTSMRELPKLESYQMGTNGKTHYQKFPLSRVSQQVVNAYLVTLDSQYRFLRYVAS
jgi:hypothetical protein